MNACSAAGARRQRGSGVENVGATDMLLHGWIFVRRLVRASRGAGHGGIDRPCTMGGKRDVCGWIRVERRAVIARACRGCGRGRARAIHSRWFRGRCACWRRRCGWDVRGRSRRWAKAAPRSIETRSWRGLRCGARSGWVRWWQGWAPSRCARDWWVFSRDGMRMRTRVESRSMPTPTSHSGGPRRCSR